MSARVQVATLRQESRVVILRIAFETKDGSCLRAGTSAPPRFQALRSRDDSV
jgi:hypothetical protein